MAITPRAATLSALLIGFVGVWGVATLRPGPQAGAPSGSPVPSPMSFLTGTPAAMVADYLEADFQGERLERANWPKFAPLVLWTREPTFESAYIVRDYRVDSGKTLRESATVDATFNTLGELNLERFSYETSPSRQTVPYQLEGTPAGWRIGTPMLRPHVGVQATVAYLTRMKSGYPHLAAAIDASLAKIAADAQADPRE